MKKYIAILCVLALTVSLFSGCSLFEKPEEQFSVLLEEAEHGMGKWECFIEPDGMIELYGDDVREQDGVLYHEWLFQGVTPGEVSITFQYTEDEVAVRTVQYACVVDEALKINLLERLDSEDRVGTAEDELLMRAVSAAIAVQFGSNLFYPSAQVENTYATEFLLAYVNLFHAELAEEYTEIKDTGYERYIAVPEETVAEILNVGFGDRFGCEELLCDNALVIYNGHQYYFAEKDVAWVSAVPAPDSEELQYVFTVTGDETSIDGNAQITAEFSEKNSAGLSIVGFTAQKNA